MHSAERFAIILVFMFGFFVFLSECVKMLKSEPVKSEPVKMEPVKMEPTESLKQVEPIYIHGTITKGDSGNATQSTIIKIDTIIIYEPIKN